MSGPKLATIKRLFAVSRNQCAFPGCDVPLAEESGTVTGEIAHIKAASDKGPRYDQTQSEDERHGFDNLILLCPRHHAIVDIETERYAANILRDIKMSHEQAGVTEINPTTAAIARTLLEKYQSIIILNNRGNVAVNSPNAVQATTLNLHTTKSKITIAAPQSAIGADRRMCSYVTYLIERYQEYQKQDGDKLGRYKYIAIYNAIKRTFRSKWQLIADERFEELVTFLQNRIDNTKIGRIRKSRDQKRYHSYEEHG